MPRLAARPGSRTGRVAVAAALVAALAQPIALAQPAVDLGRAKDLYRSAEVAMKEGRFDDAARDYGAAYEWSKDPALFFKIGRANEGAGRCEVALSYYARYLREGKPDEQFAATTRERIAACGGDARSVEGGAATSPADSGAPAPPSPGVPDEPASAGAAPSTEPTAGADGTAQTDRGQAGAGAGDPGAGGVAADAGGAADGAEAGKAERPSLIPSNHHKAAWLLTGGAAALAALGGVLAYATNASENDVRDLYVGLAGQPVTFDGQTRRRYDELVTDGRRYQNLSWTAFGLAGAAAAGAAVLFVLGRDEAAPAGRVTPLVTSRGAGVAVRF
jgi:hypothetical protein